MSVSIPREPPDDAALSAAAAEVGAALKMRGLMLTTAESCTGGWVAQVITGVAGSSEWFERGFVTYTNTAKHEMLGVSQGTLEKFGAVSEEVVREMAGGALKHSRAEVSLAVSGVAGPGGGTPLKPVGIVCLAWAAKGESARSRVEHFSGNREAIRRRAVYASLQGMLDFTASAYPEA
ncbi:MAG: nicotinamide-nucleotide amidohydrolase family protein [Gammaproteobacteria bacterium]|nr:nicotinamide-nucleotide amidohydrolase family protein [Gammaproteobacteria bacterium]